MEPRRSLQLTERLISTLMAHVKALPRVIQHNAQDPRPLLVPARATRRPPHRPPFRRGPPPAGTDPTDSFPSWPRSIARRPPASAPSCAMDRTTLTAALKPLAAPRPHQRQPRPRGPAQPPAATDRCRPIPAGGGNSDLGAHARHGRTAPCRRRSRRAPPSSQHAVLTASASSGPAA